MSNGSNAREAWAALVRQHATKLHKYGAKKKIVDGFTFDSTKEASRYQELKLREFAGEIRNLELQPRFHLDVLTPIGEIVTIGRFTADFRYIEVGYRPILDHVVVEDVKSAPTRTEAYMLRKRHVEAQYGIEIREV